jgi:hypothetical protein
MFKRVVDELYGEEQTPDEYFRELAGRFIALTGRFFNAKVLLHMGGLSISATTAILRCVKQPGAPLPYLSPCTSCQSSKALAAHTPNQKRGDEVFDLASDIHDEKSLKPYRQCNARAPNVGPTLVGIGPRSPWRPTDRDVCITYMQTKIAARRYYISDAVR